MVILLLFVRLSLPSDVVTKSAISVVEGLVEPSVLVNTSVMYLVLSSPSLVVGRSVYLSRVLKSGVMEPVSIPL